MMYKLFTIEENVELKSRKFFLNSTLLEMNLAGSISGGSTSRPLHVRSDSHICGVLNVS